MYLCICVFVFVFMYLYLCICICVFVFVLPPLSIYFVDQLSPVGCTLCPHSSSPPKTQKDKNTNIHRTHIDKYEYRLRDKYFLSELGSTALAPFLLRAQNSRLRGETAAANSSVSANFFSSFILSQKVLGENSDVFFSVFSLVPEKFQNPFPWSSV